MSSELKKQVLEAGGKIIVHKGTTNCFYACFDQNDIACVQLVAGRIHLRTVHKRNPVTGSGFSYEIDRDKPIITNIMLCARTKYPSGFLVMKNVEKYESFEQFISIHKRLYGMEMKFVSGGDEVNWVYTNQDDTKIPEKHYDRLPKTDLKCQCGENLTTVEFLMENWLPVGHMVCPRCCGVFRVRYQPSSVELVPDDEPIVGGRNEKA